MKSALPYHVGIIPDGNRRWAAARGLPKGDGYRHGVDPGLRLFRACRAAGIRQLSVYGFTQDNVRRPSEQVGAFQSACVELAASLVMEGADIRVVGQADSTALPAGLKRYMTRVSTGDVRVNLLANYSWKWDLAGLKQGEHRTSDVPPLDLIIRWGGGRRLSGFLPIQSVYADFHVIDALWPDFEEEHLAGALAWFKRQDRTLGG